MFVPADECAGHQGEWRKHKEKKMKKLAVMTTLALIAGSASANFVLSDAEWGNLGQYTDGSAGLYTSNGTVNSISDGPLGMGDIAVEATVSSYLFNSDLGIYYGAVWLTNSISGQAGDVWDVQISNPNNNFMYIQQFAIINGGTETNGTELAIFDQALGGSNPNTQALSFDLSGATSIDSVGFIMYGSSLGSPGMATVDMVIPEPATLGMIVFLGGGMIWIRKRFMI